LVTFLTWREDSLGLRSAYYWPIITYLFKDLDTQRTKTISVPALEQ